MKDIDVGGKTTVTEKFIRLKATDGIELCGIFYSPNKKSKKTVLYVHGLADNFYTNKYVSYIAEMYTNKGYNFLTYNNRGNGFFSNLLKEDDGKVSVVKGGGAYEVFEESRLDLDGILNYLNSIGNEEVILQGHSFGCNKVIDYCSYTENKISKIVLLSPCDIVTQQKAYTGLDYDKLVAEAKNLYEEGKGEEVLKSLLFPLTFSAKTLVTSWLPETSADIFRYRDSGYIHEKLKNIKIPVLVEFGTKDKLALVFGQEETVKFFNNNLSKCKINFIENAAHYYYAYEEQLAKDIEEWL